ncbi:MAG: type I polyketide synthase, partial [Caldilinea sp.]
RCKTFDATANGYGRGEGCGVVVLKRLSDAQADGDTIWAVIRGSMLNHDGRSSGLTAPNGPAQQSVIQQALQNAGVDPAEVAYVEAHGTGTALGDPIEIGALTAVFGNRTTPLWVGAVKTNVGHLEGAAGITSLIKVVLAMHHGEIPPHLHFQQPSPLIDWAATPVQIPVTLIPWPAEQAFAGVSSFGLSGTNAHIVLERVAPPPVLAQAEAERNTEQAQVAESPWQLLTLSAKTEAALLAQAQQYHDFFARSPAVSWPDICYTTHVARSHFAYRLALTAASVAQMREQLTAYTTGQQNAALVQGVAPTDATGLPIAFMFTGQGAQFVEMGEALYRSHPLFRATLVRCEALYREYTGESLLAVLYPELTAAERGESAPGSDAKSSCGTASLDDTTYTQPALFAMEYALAQVWQSWGIRPQVVIGHSVGEVAAACVAGVFSLEDGMKLVAARGRLIGALPHNGIMVAVTASEAEVQQVLAPYADRVAIAAVNGARQVVLSGERDAVAAVVAGLTAADDAFSQRSSRVKIKNLTVSHAFHSPLMDPMLDAFRQVAASISYHPPQVPLVSNRSGRLAGTEVSTPEYWVRHVRDAVRFGDGISTVQEMGIEVLLEIGPRPVLSGLVQANHSEVRVSEGKQGTGSASGAQLVTLPSLREHQPDWQQMLTSLGALYVRGATLDWLALDQRSALTPRRKVALPTYPFQRHRYWMETARHMDGIHVLSPLIDKMIKSPALQQILFETAMSGDRLPFLRDHRVYGAMVAPGACHLSMALSAIQLAAQTMAGQPERLSYQITDIIFPEALIIPEGGARTVQLILTPTGSPARSQEASDPHFGFQLLSFDPPGTPLASSQPAIHATGSIRAGHPPPPATPTLPELQTRYTTAIPFPAHNADASPAIAFGPAFQWFDAAWQRPDEPAKQAVQGGILGRLRRPAVVEPFADGLPHPGLFDACFQLAGLANSAVLDKELYLPFALAGLTLYPTTDADDPGDFWWCHVVQIDTQKWNIQLFDAAGHCLAMLDGFTVRAAPQAVIQATRVRADWLYTPTWSPKPLVTAVADQAVATPLVRPDGWLVVGTVDEVGEAFLALLQAEKRPLFWATTESNGSSPSSGIQPLAVDWDDGRAVHSTIGMLTDQYPRLGVIYLGGSR